MDYTVHGILQARILEWVAFPFSRVSSQPRIKPRSPELQADSLPAESQGKPKFFNHFLTGLFVFLNYCWVTRFLFVCLTMTHGLWDLSFPARDWNWALSSEATESFFFPPTLSIWWKFNFWTQNAILREKSFSLLVLMWLPEVLNTHVALVRCILDSTALTNSAQFQNTLGDKFIVLVF